MAPVNDADVIEAFVNQMTRSAFGPTLHVESDVLMLDGWWHTSLRIAPDAFIVRNEELPVDSTVLEDLAAVLGARGLQPVGEDHPLIQPITYTSISLGAAAWAMWAADAASMEAALTAKLSDETSFVAAEPGDYGMESALGFTPELGGARRVGGLPPSIVLTVGVPKDRADQLAGLLDDCRVEARSFEDTPPEACGMLVPNLIMVDATDQAGLDWAIEVRANACGRFLPVIALVRDGGVPPGADVALHPDAPVADWVGPLRQMLP